MPSFALHPISRITRSISSPYALASQNQTTTSSLTHPPSPRSPSSSPSSHSSDSHHNNNDMHRLNPLNFISAMTSSSSSHQHPEHSHHNKPPSPVSSSSASSVRDSLPLPSVFSHHRRHKSHPKHHSSHPPADLPPVSPLSSMYDPNSREVSADGSGLSDDDSAESTPLSSSSASDSLDGNVFLRPRSTRENRIHTTDSPHFHSRDLGPPVAFRRALFETPSAPDRRPNLSAPMSSRSRERVFAGIAARGKVVDEFVANRHVPDITTRDHTSHPVQGMSRVLSAKSLEIPRGRVEQLPVPRPMTPSHIPRPDTPSRLPRPRVFIKPSPSRHSVVDPVAVTHDSETPPGEAEFVTREIPRPTTPAPELFRDIAARQISSTKDRSLQEDFYFSDEEHVEEDASSEYQLEQYTTGAPTPSDMLSYKVRRAVSALRSISFQSHNPEDIETAWGQAHAADLTREKIAASTASNRWRRVCGRISSKNGVQEYGCQSEADAHSISSYNSNYSAQRDRVSSREQNRGVIGVPLRGDRGSRQKRSLWTGGKRDRQSPQTRAAELLLSNGQGLLAASTDSYDANSALTTVPPFEQADMSRSNPRRGSVDKYVEFIHASAQREARNRYQYRTLRSRIVNRMFRRRWN